MRSSVTNYNLLATLLRAEQMSDTDTASGNVTQTLVFFCNCCSAVGLAAAQVRGGCFR